MSKQPSRPKSRWRRRDYILLPTIYLLLLLSAVMYVTARYKKQHFGDAQIDEIIFYFMNGFSDGQSTTFVQAAQDNLLLTLAITLLLLLPVVDFYRNKIHFHINLSLLGRARTLQINPSNIPMWLKLAYTGIIFSLALWYLLSSFGVGNYLRALSQSSTVFEDHYVDPSSAGLKFPETKRNLVYIYLESMENTVASQANGGQAPASLIPELEQLALDPNNVSFSHLPAGQGLGGAMPIHGTTWTVAGMTAQAGGIPLKPNVLGRDQNDMGDFNDFLPGATMLGDILKQQGYNQSFVMGSESSFGGRDKLLGQHGGYHIIDLPYAREHGLLPSDYKVWWGYEDRKVFEFARAEAERLASLGQPFNLQLLTADTHFSDGYLDPTCPTPHQQQYDNVYACSSARIAEFVAWLQSQPYADNTTIIIAGDHLGMQTTYYDTLTTTPDYVRTTYNAIINSASSALNTRERLFTSLDMLPTTLAAMGVDIPGGKLALGANLFSDEPTLLETYSNTESLNEALSRRSHYYERQIRITP